MTHTPGPHIENELLPDMLPLTYYEVDDENETCTILGDGQTYIGKIDSIDGYNKEITESILHRVNTHAALVDALRVLLQNCELGEYECQKQGKPRMIESRELARHALALAEGKEPKS